MKPGISFIVLIICTASVSAVIAEGAEHEIIWVKNNAPPFYILSGEQRGQAFGDRVQHLIEMQLPGYNHVTLEMPLARLNLAWSKQLPRCFSTMIYEPSDQEDYLLSIPNLYYLPHGIITTTAFAATLQRNENDAVSLVKLLRRDGIRMGMSTGRSYGVTLDSILEQHKENMSFVRRTGTEETRGVLNMLVKDRFDFVIDYHFLLEFYSSDNSFADALVFLPIAETENEGVSGSIGCTRNEWGRLVINDINRAIRQLSGTEAYRNIIRDWLIAPGRESQYWEGYNNQVIGHTGENLPE